MSAQKHSESLYNDFLNYDYQELEELVSKAKDKTEREFYARLCDFLTRPAPAARDAGEAILID